MRLAVKFFLDDQPVLQLLYILFYQYEVFFTPIIFNRYVKPHNSLYYFVTS